MDKKWNGEFDFDALKVGDGVIVSAKRKNYKPVISLIETEIYNYGGPLNYDELNWDFCEGGIRVYRVKENPYQKAKGGFL